MSRIRRAAPLAMGGVFTASGLLHFVRPQSFETIMPRTIPTRHHRRLVYASGLAELVCALGLFRRARWAPAAATAVLAGVFPANVQMALDSGSGRHAGAADRGAVAWGRLPLQALMIWAVRQSPPDPSPDAGG
jgi:uncharacterized membrane protein